MSSVQTDLEDIHIDLDWMACEAMKVPDVLVVQEMSSSATIVLSSVTVILTALLIIIGLLAIWGWQVLRKSMIAAAIGEVKEVLTQEITGWINSDQFDMRPKIEDHFRVLADDAVKRALRSAFDDDSMLDAEEGDGDDNE